MGFLPSLKSIKHTVIHAAEKVVDAAPVALVVPTLSDKADHFLQSLETPSFPKTVPVPKAAAPGPVSNAKLTAASPAVSFKLNMAATGDARVDLSAAGPGTNWAKKGAESAVMSVYVDGKYQSDVVLSGGAQQTPYAVSLGQLSRGEHTVTLRYAKEKSAAGATGIDVRTANASAATYATKQDQWAAENAPILIGRHGSLENNSTDTPLGLFHHVSSGPEGTTRISYGYAFSNEDGGDGADPSLEQARWGRLTDLQHVYTVTLDKDGKVLDRSYEGAGHHMHTFEGALDGTHAVLRTATNNNNVTDSGGGPLRFALPTDNAVGDMPTEELMHQHPEWFRVEGEELQREGKIDPNGVGNAPRELGIIDSMFGAQQKMADPRDYLYVQLDATGAKTDPVTARVTLKDGRTFDSSLGQRDAAIARDGWAQTTVRLPPGTKRATSRT
jgi:hypothetical protein